MRIIKGIASFPNKRERRKGGKKKKKKEEKSQIATLHKQANETNNKRLRKLGIKSCTGFLFSAEQEGHVGKGKKRRWVN